MAEPENRPVVLPFFRASVQLEVRDRALFNYAMSDDEFLTTLKRSPITFRHNLQRLLVASIVAQEHQADLVLMEGWKSNHLKPNGNPYTGSAIASVMLRLLQRRSLTAFAGTVHRRNISCCTWQEILAVQKEFPGRPIFGVSSSPCPSAKRAGRYLRLIVGEPSRMQRKLPTMTPKQQAVYDCCTPGGVGFIPEAINWGVHGISELHRFITRTTIPLEMRLAIKLRMSQPK
jgi:hypothetical protein